MRQYIDIKDCLDIGNKDMTSAALTMVDGKEFQVGFQRQKTGYGERLFMQCPRCGRRRMKLYIYKELLLCRDCYPFPVYRGIKNVTPGGYKYIGYRMRKFAAANGIAIKKFPFDYLEYERPKYKHKEKWEEQLKILQALENMRIQSHEKKFYYSVETVNSVLKYKNLYLYASNLEDLAIYAYDWELGREAYCRYFEETRGDIK